MAFRYAPREVYSTPFGNPSSPVTIGSLGEIKLAFIPRHGTGHSLLPSEVPYRANVYALKTLGVKRVVSVSAVGSLSEKIKPLDIVIPDQLIDRTKTRENTFFGDGLVAHISFANPFCQNLSKMIASFFKDLEIELISRTLKKHGNNRRKTARTLGISERTLYRKINEYELEKD